MPDIPIPTALLQALGNYLAAEPYYKVAKLLSDLQEAVQKAQALPTDAGPAATLP